MRKQYQYEYSGLRVYINLYHDGKLVESKKVWQGDEAMDELDRLEEEGYTYGYTEEEIADEKKRYEYMLENMIEVKNE